MSWYYELNEQQQGPVTEEELKSLINDGKLPPQSRVWTQGMADWEEYEKVFAEDAGLCPYCGEAASPEVLIPAGDTKVCPACRDTYAQRMREGVSGNLIPGSRGTGGTLTAAELRAQARVSLAGNWGTGVGATIVFALISIGASFIPIIGVIIQYLITGPISVGMSRLFLNIGRDENPEFGDMFKGFNQFLPSLGAYFLLAVISFLAAAAGAIPGGIFLAIVAIPAVQSGASPESDPMFAIALMATMIPAIIATMYVSLRYGLIYFIIADEDKDLGVFDAFKESSRLMKGRMLKLL
ncbi:MAG: DUF975 family protein [Opitutales bacterium]